MKKGIAVRMTGEGEGEVCAVSSKWFGSGTWNPQAAHAAAAAIATAYDSTIMKGSVNVKVLGIYAREWIMVGCW